jgi:hypothetical protein
LLCNDVITSDSLTAKVEVTLLDGSKVIVNVPVKVVEKELSVLMSHYY